MGYLSDCVQGWAKVRVGLIPCTQKLSAAISIPSLIQDGATITVLASFGSVSMAALGLAETKTYT